MPTKLTDTTVSSYTLSVATKNRRTSRGTLARPSASQRPLSLGASYMSGRRDRVPASRNPLLLPRTMAVAFPGRVKDLAYRSSRVRSQVLRLLPQQSPNLFNSRARAWLALRATKIARAELIRPSLNLRSSPCTTRATRKSVLFSLGVAGRGWGSGGPNMRGARRTLSSQFRCK